MAANARYKNIGEAAAEDTTEKEVWMMKLPNMRQ